MMVGRGPNEERDVMVGNTLVTYQNEDEESVTGDDTNKFQEFFNMHSRSDIHNFFSKSDDEDADSDYTEGEIDPDQADEGYRRIKTYNYDKDTCEDLTELQKLLENIKKDNTEIKKREEELKNKFGSLKNTYNKIMKEKSTLESRQNGKWSLRLVLNLTIALTMREHCLKTEKRNLQEETESLKREQESCREGVYELENLRDILRDVQKEEEEERERTMELEDKIRELSKYLRDENSRIKDLENNICSQRLSHLIHQHNRHSTILQIAPS